MEVLLHFSNEGWNYAFSLSQKSLAIIVVSPVLLCTFYMIVIALGTFLCYIAFNRECSSSEFHSVRRHYDSCVWCLMLVDFGRRDIVVDSHIRLHQETGHRLTYKYYISQSNWKHCDSRRIHLWQWAMRKHLNPGYSNTRRNICWAMLTSMLGLKSLTTRLHFRQLSI